MATLKFHQSHTIIIPQNPPLNPKYNPLITHLITSSSSSSSSSLKRRIITCGLRNMGPKKPMWRSSFMSTEAIQASHMKASGCIPDKLTLIIMVRNMEKAGREDLSASVKIDFEEYVDEPEKFLEEVEKKYSRNPLLVV